MARSKKLALVITALLIFLLCATCQAQGFVERIFGKLETDKLEPPACLTHLRGGIDTIEETLKSTVHDSDEIFIVLVTASSDRASQPAEYTFYEAAKKACSEDLLDKEQDKGRYKYLLDDKQDKGEDGEQKQWHWAHLEFQDEPGMIWRWWIWKVPTIVFISHSSSPLRPYHLRFWKIAWRTPKPEQIASVLESDRWLMLEPWTSSLSPGGTRDFIPLYLARGFSLFYNVIDPVPSWLLTLMSSGLGIVLLRYLHSGDKQAQIQANRAANSSSNPKPSQPRQM